MAKSEALKRVTVESVDEIIDQAMEYLPVALDLANPDDRLKVRNWMHRVCVMAMRRSANTIRNAAQNAISDAVELVIDTDYYEQKRKRAERRKAQKNTPPISKAEYDFALLKTKDTVQ